jgi:tripartite-type tricarboxylate transporter receptor subunit TctC
MFSEFPMRRRSRTALVALTLTLMLGLASFSSSYAQSYPIKPIRLIAPYPAGGGIDTVSRIIGEKLAVRLAQPLLVENRPGAGATIGADALVKSAADGYTLMVGSMVDYSLSPHFHRNLSFDMGRDFVAIGEIGSGTVAVIVTPDLPVTSLKELIALAKAKPGELSFASSGQGGLIHLNGEMFKQMAGVDLVHVPYKGTTQLLPDLMAGRIPLAIDSIPAHLPHIKSGKLRVLAVTTRERSPLLPEVPTMAEAGLPGFESATNYTLFAPAATPKEIVSQLNRELNAVLQMPEVRDRLLGLGIVASGGSSEAAQARIAPEMNRWAKVIKAANIKTD